jgi:hypothetical protein
MTELGHKRQHALLDFEPTMVATDSDLHAGIPGASRLERGYALTQARFNLFGTALVDLLVAADRVRDVLAAWAK